MSLYRDEAQFVPSILVQSEERYTEEEQLDDHVLDFEYAIAELEQVAGMAFVHKSPLSGPLKRFRAFSRPRYAVITGEAPAGGH